MRKNLSSKRVGLISKNNYGSLMEIIEYNKATDMRVKFLEHGNLVPTRWERFCRGEVKNPYDKSVYGIGYIGEGEYKTSNGNSKHTPQYNKWFNMLMRCYSKKYQEKNPTYIGCTVSEEWHNFQNFAKWYDENYYQIDNEIMELDKDILVKGNKIYSSETCIFVNHAINTLFIKSDSTRGEFPIGVNFIEKDITYVVRCCDMTNDRVYLGSFDSKNEAFQAYKLHKENYIKGIAEKYKDKIPNKLYKAMINYIVEITD